MQIDVRGGRGRSEGGVPGAPGPPGPRKRPIFSQIPNTPLLNPREIALELVSGADFSCKSMCGAGPVDLRGSRGPRGWFLLCVGRAPSRLKVCSAAGAGWPASRCDCSGLLHHHLQALRFYTGPSVLRQDAATVDPNGPIFSIRRRASQVGHRPVSGCGRQVPWECQALGKISRTRGKG